MSKIVELQILEDAVDAINAGASVWDLFFINHLLDI